MSERNENNDKGELVSRLINSPKDITILIEGTEMLAEDSLDKLPVWKHVKMNYKAWSSVGKMCVSSHDPLSRPLCISKTPGPGMNAFAFTNVRCLSFYPSPIGVSAVKPYFLFVPQ